MCASGKQASQEWRDGSMPRRAVVAARRGSDGLVCEDDSLRLSRRARGGDHEGVTRFDGLSVGQGMLLAVGGDDACRTQRVEHGAPRHAGQPRVERRRGVAGVPDGA